MDETIYLHLLDNPGIFFSLQIIIIIIFYQLMPQRDTTFIEKNNNLSKVDIQLKIFKHVVSAFLNKRCSF